jgi:hypothetical protein
MKEDSSAPETTWMPYDIEGYRRLDAAERKKVL